jgi:hypothetical protein
MANFFLHSDMFYFQPSFVICTLSCCPSLIPCMKKYVVLGIRQINTCRKVPLHLNFYLDGDICIAFYESYLSTADRSTQTVTITAHELNFNHILEYKNVSCTKPPDTTYWFKVTKTVSDCSFGVTMSRTGCSEERWPHYAGVLAHLSGTLPSV